MAKQSGEREQIMLGFKVKDRLTGFTGVAISRHFRMGGYVQYGVQPACDPRKTSAMPDATSFDEMQLEQVGKKAVVKAVPAAVNVTPLALGDEVRDRASGVVGMIINRHEYMNGCVFFTLQPRGKDGEAIPKEVHLPAFRIEKLGPGMSAAVPSGVGTRATGGPSRIAERC